jgi:hypothetical protein
MGDTETGQRLFRASMKHRRRRLHSVHTWSQPSALFSGNWGQSEQGVSLSAHPHQVLRLRRAELYLHSFVRLPGTGGQVRE